MKYSILLCLGAAALMGCASVDGTAVTQTPTDTPNSDIQAPTQMVAVSPALAHALYVQGKQAESFDMNYALATRGDDRSQYNIGVSYHNGIEGRVKRNYVEAYAWMLTSEMVIQEPTRVAAVNALRERLSQDQLLTAQERAAVLFDQYGSGDRAPSNLELIDSYADSTVPHLSCSYLGSRLERDCHGARSFRGRGQLNDSPITGAAR